MVNKVILIGNLGADPELRSTNAGQSVCTIRLATSEKFKDKEGQTQERTEWHQVVVWGQQADVVNRYCKKGKQIYVEGRLQTRKWTDKNNQERYTTEIVADNVRFLSGGAAAGEGAEEGGGGRSGGYSGGGSSGGYGGRGSSEGGGRSGGYGSRGGSEGGGGRGRSAPPVEDAPFGSDDDIPF